MKENEKKKIEKKDAVPLNQIDNISNKTKEEDIIKKEKIQEKEIPEKIKSLIGGDLFGEGKTSITYSDKKGDDIAVILEKRKSVEGHGIEYSAEFCVAKGSKVYEDRFYTYRGAYRDEPDDWAHAWQKIEILESKGDMVKVRVSSFDLVVIYEVDLENNSAEILETRNLKEEREAEERAKLEQQLRDSEKDFDKYLQNLSIKIEKEHESQGIYAHMKTTKVKDDLAIIEAALNPYEYDPVETEIEFYIMKKGWKKPKKVVKNTEAPTDRPRFSDTYAEIEYGKVKETENEIEIPVKMKVKRAENLGQPRMFRGVALINEEEFELKVKTDFN